MFYYINWSRNVKADAAGLYHLYLYGYGCPPDAYCSTRWSVAVLCAIAHTHHLNTGIPATQAKQGRKRQAYAPFFCSTFRLSFLWVKPVATPLVGVQSWFPSDERMLTRDTHQGCRY